MMNGLTLRINPSSKKAKNSMGFSPIVLSNDTIKGIKNDLHDQFVNSTTADEQLVVVKKILESLRESGEAEVMRYLSIVFLQAEVKHPVKCFITRHITKNEQFQDPFAVELGKEIMRLIATSYAEYSQYIGNVSKIATCIENFPAGALAIKSVEIELANHLKDCLECCIKTLRESKLSPTEKNEIYNLSHLALRLFLYILQKVNKTNVGTFSPVFIPLRNFIKYLVFDEDSPMDTKSICGILFLSMELLENGPDSWITILESTEANENIKYLLENEAGQLSLYSAITTVVPVDRIQVETASGQSAIVCLTEKIMSIGERSSAESTFILGVTRTLVQISKMLDKVLNSIGYELTEHVLSFVWGHLEHYMDSVRHLTAQALTNVVRYCTNLQKRGDETGLNKLFVALGSLDRTRKGYYVSLTALTAQLGATRIMQRMPDVINDVIDALSVQAVQASATTALEILIQKHSQECDSESIYHSWVVPILHRVRNTPLDSAVLSILENLLAKAVSLDENVFNYILPHIKESSDPTSSYDLKCVLMLLSVSRKSGVAGKLAVDASPDDWKGIISYDVLKRAAVDAVDETRILSLSLVAESPKSTEAFSEGDLSLVLYYLKYNSNAQSPNFRQLTLSNMKKFIKRLEESHKALCRSSSLAGAHYLSFMGQFRSQCFAGLTPGANYSRRLVALQLLAWAGEIQLAGYISTWKHEYIEKLLIVLEDSYENNKALALQILDTVPSSEFQGKNYRVSLDIEDILHEASSMKPTDCVSAAYKLHFIIRKLPERILKGNEGSDVAEPVWFECSKILLDETKRHLAICTTSVVYAARNAPVYTVLHCLRRLLDHVDASSISEDKAWKSLVSDIISTCIEVNAAVASVVNNSSPEGHLPMDAGGVTDHGNAGDILLEDGRPVTAQMVLLCAWRSVKEVSLLLGAISSRLSIEGEGQEHGTLSHQQMALIGKHFTKLLAETKHRGAFEQAYVGFTKHLARLWRCRSASLHSRPRTWLLGLIQALRSKRNGTLCATRRSAGLPFMIQALVTTELQVQGNPKCLHECITTLLQLARCTYKDLTLYTTNKDESNTVTTQNQNNKEIYKDLNTTSDDVSNMSTTQNHSNTEKLDSNKQINDSTVETEETNDSVIETRTHSVNILRALFRNSMLEESVSTYVEEGLMVALQGFEGDTWMERNSSTLLFSALMVRIFGVTRDRHSDTPSIRNTMTGRIFFLRHPRLYDFILNKLKDAESSVEEHLHPSLYPVLVLLGRLYPSSLEGTASTLRLVALVPRVVSCARSRVLNTRQLAAKAIVPLISPEQFFPHISLMFAIIKSRDIKRNYCHGILLQLSRLFDRRPSLVPGQNGGEQIMEGIKHTYWILEQATEGQPCYMIADEYVRMMNLIIWRYPCLITNDMLITKQGYLDRVLFTDNIPRITSGREVCLANCIYLYLVILSKISDATHIQDLVFKGLEHKSYEVVLSTLNYILILYKKKEIGEECKFQQHLSNCINENVLEKLRNSNQYVEKLCEILRSNKYLECVQKALRVLILEKDTQKYIVAVKIGIESNISDEEVIKHLFNFIQNEHEKLTHIYLEALSSFVTEKLTDLTISKATLLEVIRMVFACSSSENSDSTREVVTSFMERNFGTLMKLDYGDLRDEDKFEFKSTLWATIVTILEDDDPTIRQRTADVIVTSLGHTGGVVPTKAAEVLRHRLRGKERDDAAVLVLLALLDFKSEVCITDEISEECRVFDQNERYNIFLEECVWTDACAEQLLQLCRDQGHCAKHIVRQIVDHTTYRETFDKLCNNNVILFRKMVDNSFKYKNEVVNPKIELFVNKLCS